VNTPAFSLILPTRNRVTLAEQVVRHTLQQSFADFELVVIDNGDDDAASRMAESVGDPRIRVVRTGGLPMYANWQAGFESARGSYVAMIEDKLFLVPDAVECWHSVFSSTSIPLLAWSLSTCTGAGCETLKPAGPLNTRKVPSQEVIGFGVESLIDIYHKQAPRGLNMAFRRDFAMEVQSQVGPLCRPMAPDYSLGALLLPFCDEFLHTYQILGRTLRGGPSTGAAVGKRTPEAEAFLNTLGMTREELLRYVPVKIAFFQNLIVSDLFRFWRAAGLDESKLPLHLDGYYMMMLSELLLAEQDGASFQPEATAIRAEFRKRPPADQAGFFFYALKRFRSGWPDRKARMRVNAGKFFRALRFLLGPSK
jgi:hypothetical protein